MDMTTINISVPKEMAVWIKKTDSEKIFECNTMMLYPYTKGLDNFSWKGCRNTWCEQIGFD